MFSLLLRSPLLFSHWTAQPNQRFSSAFYQSSCLGFSPKLALRARMMPLPLLPREPLWTVAALAPLNGMPKISQPIPFTSSKLVCCRVRSGLMALSEAKQPMTWEPTDESQRERSRSPDRRGRSRSPNGRRSYSPRDRSRSRPRRRSRSPMTGQGATSGGQGSGYGGNAQQPRSYEEREAHRSQMVSNIRESSQQDRRVYVGNLSYDVKWHHLKDFMRSGTLYSFGTWISVHPTDWSPSATAGEVLFADVLLLPNGMSKVGFK